MTDSFFEVLYEAFSPSLDPVQLNYDQERKGEITRA